VDGGRTHRGPQRDPPPVLKTGEPTGTQPLPTAKDTAGKVKLQVINVKKSLSGDKGFNHFECDRWSIWRRYYGDISPRVTHNPIFEIQN
jgi:hypothetical protein